MNRTNIEYNSGKIIELTIFMGQSNMAGRGEIEKAVICPKGHGYEFRSVTNPDALFDITEPFGNMENNVINDFDDNGKNKRLGDMVSAVMESYYQETGIPIVGVQCSRGGTDTAYWNREDIKEEAMRRLMSAKKYLADNGYTVNNIFMVWAQGESDADRIAAGEEDINTYKANSLKIFQYMKDAGVRDIFIVQTGHINVNDNVKESAYLAVNAAQKAFTEEMENVYTVSSFLGFKSSMKDAYHYHQDAYNAVGMETGKRIAEILRAK